MKHFCIFLKENENQAEKRLRGGFSGDARPGNKKPPIFRFGGFCYMSTAGRITQASYPSSHRKIRFRYSSCGKTPPFRPEAQSCTPPECNNGKKKSDKTICASK